MEIVVSFGEPDCELELPLGRPRTRGGKAAPAGYRLYGLPQNLRFEHPGSARDFPREVRDAAAQP